MDKLMEEKVKAFKKGYAQGFEDGKKITIVSMERACEIFKEDIKLPKEK